MSKVTPQEIVVKLRSAAREIAPHKRQSFLCEELANRIEQHGIAPPDGMVLVPIITEATTFNCKINGDPPQVDHAWTPPCKIWCGKKYCTPKVNPCACQEKK